MVGGGDQEALPPEAVLVRFGAGSVDTLRRNANTHYDYLADEGLEPSYALSCDYGVDRDAHEIAMRSTHPAAASYKPMRQTTVAKMNALGLQVFPEGDRDGHGRIELGPELDDELLERVQDAFMAKEDNPRYGMEEPWPAQD